MESDNPYARVSALSLMIIAAVLLTASLSVLRTVCVPFAFSVMIYSVMLPGVRWMQEKWKVGRLLSFLLIFLLFALVLVFLISFLSTSVEGFIEDSGKYRERLLAFLQWLSAEFAAFGVVMDVTVLWQGLRGLPVIGIAQNVTGGVMALIGKSILVMVFVLFFVVGGEGGGITNPLVAEIRTRIARYVTAKLLTSLATGAIVGIVLGTVGVELAFMFAVITVMLNFIPNLGSIVATFLPLPVVLLQFGLGWEFFAVVGLTSATQFTIGNILEPMIMGESLGLHPVTVLVSLIFWGIVWGVPGMFLAVPLTSIIRLVLTKSEMGRPVAEVFAGRFPE
jgi:AI-2 transport protein TqsA